MHMQKAYVLFSFNLMTTLFKLIQQRMFPISEKETNLQQ